MTILSAARLARLATEAWTAGGRVTFAAPRYHGGQSSVSWPPETAVAVAGHICQHWGHEASIGTRPVAIEYERGLAVTLRYTPAGGDGPYRDTNGHRLELAADTDHDGRPVVTVWGHAPFARIPVRVPLNEVQALVTSLQETARQAAAGSNPQHIGGGANAEDCPACSVSPTPPPYPFICPGDQQ